MVSSTDARHSHVPFVTSQPLCAFIRLVRDKPYAFPQRTASLILFEDGLKQSLVSRPIEAFINVPVALRIPILYALAS